MEMVSEPADRWMDRRTEGQTLLGTREDNNNSIRWIENNNTNKAVRLQNHQDHSFSIKSRNKLFRLIVPRIIYGF